MRRKWPFREGLRARGYLLRGILILLLQGCSQHYEEGSHPPPIPPAGPQAPQAPQAPASKGSKGGGEVAKRAGEVRGTVRIASELAGRARSKAYLFIIARQQPDGGTPYAVKRVSLPEFPYDYSLGRGDAAPTMGDQAPFAGVSEIYLVARIGQTAIAQTGDLEGVCAGNPVAPGQDGRDILIDRVR